jgi:hypothetical protein
VTGLTAVYTTDIALSSLPASVTSTSTAASTQAIPIGTTSSSSTSTAKSGATQLYSDGGLKSLTLVVVVAIAAFMAFLL